MKQAWTKMMVPLDKTENNVTKGTFAHIIQKFKTHGTVANLPGRGHRRKIDDKYNTRLTSLRNRKLLAAQIRDQINATQSSSSRPISRTTVNRRLRESGIHGQISARKPLLRRGNKQNRFVWAKKHKEWTLDQWKSTMTPNTPPGCVRAI
uniref:Transposase Tc1-like domain-containing protein n=1 Tax=Denticeps clupeoides TaxID=299321 RepID=A0AAY4AX06_9TELE